MLKGRKNFLTPLFVSVGISSTPSLSATNTVTMATSYFCVATFQRQPNNLVLFCYGTYVLLYQECRVKMYHKRFHFRQCYNGANENKSTSTLVSAAENQRNQNRVKNFYAVVRLCSTPLLANLDKDSICYTDKITANERARTCK